MKPLLTVALFTGMVIWLTGWAGVLLCLLIFGVVWFLPWIGVRRGWWP